MSADSPAVTVARLARLLEKQAAKLTIPQYRALALLAGGDQRAGLLAARLTVARPTLTALVDTLVEKGLVARDASPGDRRAISLSITDLGHEVLSRTDAQFTAALSSVIDDCADPDLVMRAFDMLVEALDRRLAASTLTPVQA